MIIFNLIGIVMFAISFGSAYGVGRIAGYASPSEGMMMMIAGPLATLLDFLYRRRYGGSWFRPSAGGSLFFLPVWGFGILWFFFGLAYLIRSHS